MGRQKRIATEEASAQPAPRAPRPQERRVPVRGDRVTRTQAGITFAGTVHYADELQVLVKWDDGRSSSLRVGRDRFSLLSQESTGRVPRADVDADAPTAAEEEMLERHAD